MFGCVLRGGKGRGGELAGGVLSPEVNDAALGGIVSDHNEYIMNKSKNRLINQDSSR